MQQQKARKNPVKIKNNNICICFLQFRYVGTTWRCRGGALERLKSACSPRCGRHAGSLALGYCEVGDARGGPASDELVWDWRSRCSCQVYGRAAVWPALLRLMAPDRREPASTMIQVTSKNSLWSACGRFSSDRRVIYCDACAFRSLGALKGVLQFAIYHHS